MIEKIDLYPEKNSTFSNCVIANDFIFTSSIGESGNENFQDALKGCFITLKEELKASGATLDDIVKITLFLKKKEKREDIDKVFHKYFKQGYPSRSIIITDFLENNIMVKIDAIAYTNSK